MQKAKRVYGQHCLSTFPETLGGQGGGSAMGGGAGCSIFCANENNCRGYENFDDYDVGGLLVSMIMLR